MNGNMAIFLIIFVVIFAVLFVVLGKSFHKDSKTLPKYDERQMAIRGRGYMIAFYTIIIVMALMAWIINDDIKTFLGDMLYFIPLCIGIPVHVMYCVWKNAYIELNLNYKLWIRYMIAIGIFNLGLGIWALADGRMIEEGVLQLNFLNLYLGILMIVIIVEIFIKNAIDGKEAEDDEESEA
jgi:hypothetical protein